MTPAADKNSTSKSAATDSISLEQLSDAFAKMLEPALAAAPAESDPGTTETSDPSGLATPLDAEQCCPITPRSILEAILFVGHPLNEPLTRQQAAAVIHGVEPTEIEELVSELSEQYGDANHAFGIIGEATGYRLSLRPEFERVRNRFYGRVREARLSQAAIEVLALVAYNQPITSKRVSNLRGHPSGAILAQLVRRQLLRLERPDEKPRTPTYHTTERFLDLFNLESLQDLPQSQDLEG